MYNKKYLTKLKNSDFSEFLKCKNKTYFTKFEKISGLVFLTLIFSFLLYLLIFINIQKPEGYYFIFALVIFYTIVPYFYYKSAKRKLKSSCILTDESFIVIINDIEKEYHWEKVTKIKYSGFDYKVYSEKNIIFQSDKFNNKHFNLVTLISQKIENNNKTFKEIITDGLNYEMKHFNSSRIGFVFLFIIVCHWFYGLTKMTAHISNVFSYTFSNFWIEILLATCIITFLRKIIFQKKMSRIQLGTFFSIYPIIYLSFVSFISHYNIDFGVQERIKIDFKVEHKSHIGKRRKVKFISLLENNNIEFEVNEAEYNNLKVGDIISFNAKKGSLNLSYFDK